LLIFKATGNPPQAELPGEEKIFVKERATKNFHLSSVISLTVLTAKNYDT
jgi:hypothetical protein